ncbi:hypothetical protein TPHA_0B01120 [Tetrapisispora phaffii CBS 4417]|uniref:TEP-1 C-terminal beta-propeller domain-containing protein n=1 Tax=Tetrapisispora phaffii (strain ATCC 24235 / CBS 4417 / NBRC 1672 / NRRL Y-8282 / UCD 70-5) TaxID=1071381 RepID=G8BQI7_TETPH|nr:hypothetical protein TPHA_0B01120 [Tetrapisispora phaffii CBS 4417]CCE61784.1 hypothetical protein TPHA_0B01120 [Tetrapisispora phaffii CBS 4417]
MSGSDHFAQVKEAISATTSILFSNEAVENTILSSQSPYKKLLQKAITNMDGDSTNAISNLQSFQEELDQDFSHLEGKEAYLRKSGDDYFTNSFVDSKTGFKVMTYLDDEILNENVSNGKTKLLLDGTREKESDTTDSRNEEQLEGGKKSSLFQGFEASLPVVDKVIEKKKATHGLITEDKDKENTGDFLSLLVSDLPDFENEKQFDTDRISRSYSLKYLKGLSENIIRTINLLLIKKDMIDDEVEAADKKLQEALKKSEKAKKKLKTAETNELQLDNILSLVKERISFIEEYDLEVETSCSKDSENVEGKTDEKTPDNTEVHTNTNLNTREDNRDDVTRKEEIKSSRISHSLNEKISSKRKSKQNKLQLFFDEELGKSKKGRTTLQHHYDSGDNILTFKGAHANGVSCLDFDVPFGTLSTAGYLDPIVKVWDLTRKVQMATLNGHMATITCMQSSPHYSMLITGSKDATIKLWNLKLASQLYLEENADIGNSNQSCIHTFSSHLDELTAISYDTINLVSGSQDKTIRQWDLLSGKCVQTIDLSFIKSRNNDFYSNQLLGEKPLVGAIQCFDAALATGTKDGIVRLWDLRSGVPVRTLEGHTDAVTALKFDSSSIVTASSDKQVRIWDLRTGTLSNAFALEKPITSLDFDSTSIICSTKTSNFQVFNKIENRHWNCGPTHDSEQSGTSNEPSESNIITIRVKDNYTVAGSDDGTISAWRV